MGANDGTGFHILPVVQFVDEEALENPGLHFGGITRFASAAALGGIPGTVGGALIMNAGGHHGEIGDFVVKVSGFDSHGKNQLVPNAILVIEIFLSSKQTVTSVPGFRGRS